MASTVSPRSAIAGLGITEMGKVFGRTSTDFAVEAVNLALVDAGLEKDALDGLLVNANVGTMLGLPTGLGLDLQRSLGLTNLRLLNVMNSAGSTVGAMVQYASMAIASGMADMVACVYADAPLAPAKGAGASYTFKREVTGLDSLLGAAGIFGANTGFAMAAQRHMSLYGTTSAQLGDIAVSNRRWATMNPRAQMRTPITIEDHQNSRMIAEPLHLLDCCLVSNGGVAVIITGADRARDLRQPPVHVIGWGQGHPGDTDDKDVRTGAVESGRTAMQMAGVTVEDIDTCQIYDCYTYTTLVTLEDYGFCEKGEGGAFVADGRLAPGGSLPTNTGGGQLSAYYMWGMTPLAEAVIQARGQGGERQLSKADVVLVSGNGSTLSHHSTLVLSPQSA